MTLAMPSCNPVGLSTSQQSMKEQQLDQSLSSPFSSINRRQPVKSAWSESRHRVRIPAEEKPANYLAGLGLTLLDRSGAGEPVRRHCATASLPVRQAASAKARVGGGGGGGVADGSDLGGGLLPKTAPPSSRTFYLGPGFQMTRSREKVLVTLDSDALFNERRQKAETVAKQSRTVEEAQRDALVAQMQRHLDSLVVMLEEERLRRREEIEALTAEMQARLEAQAKQYEGKLAEMKLLHQGEVQRLESEKVEQAKDSERKYNLMRKDLESQITYLKSSFDAYKDSYTKELEAKWRAQEAELIARGEANAQRLVQEATNQLLMERAEEVQALEAGHAEEIKKMRLQHERELSELNSRYSDMDGTVQRLAAATRDLLAKDEKIKVLMDQLDSKSREADTLAKSLSEVRAELETFKAHFDEQVKRVDEKYKSRIATLRLEAVDLRKAYISKCKQLVELRKADDTRLAERVQSSKEIMRDVIRARHRVEVSLAALDPSEEALEPLPYERRFSQPTTGQERKLAAQSAGHVHS